MSVHSSGVPTQISIDERNITQPRAAILSALVLFAILLLTNRYATMGGDSALVNLCCTDGYAYTEIARAFPDLPAGDPPRIAFHHAQRFVVPWIAGGLARMSGLAIDDSFRVLSIGFSLGTILLTLLLLRETGAGLGTQTGLLTVFIFNAYAFRFNLGFSWYVNDLAFVFGVAVTLFGLLKGRGTAVLAGIVIASVSRQTALLMLPPLVAWLVLAGGLFRGRVRITLAVICPIAAIGIYRATGSLAGEFAKASGNLETVTGIFTWFGTEFSPASLAEFAVRVTLPLLPVLLLGAALVERRRRFTRADLRFWLLLFMSGAIAAQPLLGGPAVTGGNAQRLVMLGFVPLLLALAHLMAANGVELPNTLQFWIMFGLGAFVTSLHHIYSFVGQNDSSHASKFAIAFLLASATMAGAAWVGWRSDPKGMRVKMNPEGGMP